MPNIGPLELAIVAIIALIIFGPKRLPELGRSLGNGMREFKASVSGENRDDDDDDDEDYAEEYPPRELENGVEEPVAETESDDEESSDEAASETSASSRS